MNFDFSFIKPVCDDVLSTIQLLSKQSLGHKLKIHTEQSGMPDLTGVKMAILGVSENRNDVNGDAEYTLHFKNIRKTFYSLFPGSWNANIADLGDILAGNTIGDTIYALNEVVSTLVKNDIIPIIIGGSQDLTYTQYRAYDNLRQMVNVVNVDAKFDLGDGAQPLNNKSFVSKIIVNEPYNLFNYSTIGYQTYFNSQEEIDLMKDLYFDDYRLGTISNNITLVEPIMRDADIVSVDLSSIRSSELSDNQKVSPNGLTGKEICAVTRYAGISNKVSSFGIYDYKVSANDTETTMLVSQMIWYFIEGVNCRIKDESFKNADNYQKYITLTDNMELVFFKSLKTNRWWIEIPYQSEANNKLAKFSLLPCTKQDYDEACNNKIPQRWYKACQKNNV